MALPPCFLTTEIIELANDEDHACLSKAYNF